MMEKLKPWLVLAVIFIAGALSGSALTMVLASHFHHPPGVAGMGSRIMGQLTRELNLSSDQQDKIRPIVEESAKDIRQAHLDEMGRDSEIIKRTNDQLAPILTADQKAKLDKLEAEGDNMFQRRMKAWGPNGDHFRGGGPNGDGPPEPPGPPRGPPAQPAGMPPGQPPAPAPTNTAPQGK